jgi:hypothetical protein
MVQLGGGGPVSATLVPVTGVWQSPDGTPETGRIILELSRPWPNTDPARAVSTGPVVCVLDDLGAISAEVVASDDPGWPNGAVVPYILTVALEGHRVARYQVALLQPGPVDLTQLTPVCVGESVAIVPVPGPPGGGAAALDDLTDVDVSLSATGMMLTKQLDGSWRGQNLPARPLNWLSDVLAPADTAAGNVLGTSGEGQWEPLPLAYIEEQIVGPLQAEIGPVAAVTAHTDLVGWLGELGDRVAALEGSAEPTAPALVLQVDNYGGGFIRVQASAVTTSTTVTVALATTPGPGGAIYPGLNDIPGTAAVWADYSGTLGHVKTAAGADVLGNTLKQWIRQGTLLTVHKDTTDPAHPNLIVDQVTNPTPAGSSLDTRYVQTATLKTIVAASADWAAFKTAVAAL